MVYYQGTLQGPPATALGLRNADFKSYKSGLVVLQQREGWYTPGGLGPFEFHMMHGCNLHGALPNTDHGVEPSGPITLIGGNHDRHRVEAAKLGGQSYSPWRSIGSLSFCAARSRAQVHTLYACVGKARDSA